MLRIIIDFFIELWNIIDLFTGRPAPQINNALLQVNWKYENNIVNLKNFDRYALLLLFNRIHILHIIAFGGAFVQDETTASVLFTIFIEHYGGGYGTNLLTNHDFIEFKNQLDRSVYLRLRHIPMNWDYEDTYMQVLSDYSAVMDRYDYDGIAHGNEHKMKILQLQQRFLADSFRHTHRF